MAGEIGTTAIRKQTTWPFLRWTNDTIPSVQRRVIEQSSSRIFSWVFPLKNIAFYSVRKSYRVLSCSAKNVFWIFQWKYPGKCSRTRLLDNSSLDRGNRVIRPPEKRSDRLLSNGGVPNLTLHYPADKFDIRNDDQSGSIPRGFGRVLVIRRSNWVQRLGLTFNLSSPLWLCFDC